MKIAIFSDLHDNRFALDRLLADAERRGVDEMLYLGDVGHSLELFGRLRLAGIPCIFGNWEVSGLGRMQDDLPRLGGRVALVCHEGRCSCRARIA